MLNGLSRYLESYIPSLALSLFRWNAEARIVVVADALSETYSPDQLASLRFEVRTGLRHDPIDARFHSLMGETYLREGKKDEAYRYFDHALLLSKTESHALQRLIQRSIGDGDYASAIRRLDLLLRRWPESFGSVASSIPGLFLTDESYDQLILTLAANPPWRGALMVYLAKQDVSVALAYRLVLDLTETSSPPSQREIAVVAAGLLKMGRYQDAYSMFVFTLSPEQLQYRGYVFNSTFAPVENLSPFSWEYRSSADADIRLSSSSSHGVTVRFLNKPAKDVRLRQTLILSPGVYRLDVRASATNLRLPRDLYWTIRCIDPGSEVMRVPIPEGNFEDRSISVEFTIHERCAAQTIGLETGLVADSWRSRYIGQVTFHKVLIESVDRVAD